jgi:hypothetical protein
MLSMNGAAAAYRPPRGQLLKSNRRDATRFRAVRIEVRSLIAVATGRRVKITVRPRPHRFGG